MASGVVSSKIYILVNNKLKGSRKSRSTVAWWVAQAVYAYSERIRRLFVSKLSNDITERGKRILDQYVLHPSFDLRWYNGFDNIEWDLNRIVMSKRDYKLIPSYEVRDSEVQIMASVITEASIMDFENYDPDVDKDIMIKDLLDELQSLPPVL